MSDVTHLISKIRQGDSAAADQLLPLVYGELRKLAAAKLAQEKPGQTLQATALVHEAYLRLVDVEKPQDWDGRGHFFAAAAEAMRRILIEQARRKKSAKAGGDRQRVPENEAEVSVSSPRIDLLDLDEALRKLEEHDALKAELVKLRYFAGLTIPQVAAALGIASSTADKYWAYAKCWLRFEMTGERGN